MTLQQKIDQAKKEGKWLRVHYQDLWYSPEQLEKENATGNFRWDANNFELRDPREKLKQLQEKLDAALEEYERYKKLIPL